MNPIKILAVFKEAFRDWVESRAQTHGAAIAFYALFSMVPILIIIIAIAGFFFGEAAAKGQIEMMISEQVGADAADAIEGLLAGIYTSGSGFLATVSGAVFLAYGATNLFAELKESLNDLWGVRPIPAPNFFGGLLRIGRDRLLSALMVFGSGGVLLAAIGLSLVITAVSGWIRSVAPNASFALKGGNQLASFLLAWVFFTLIFKTLADVKIPISVAVVAAFVTSILFNAGNLFVGLYLRFSIVKSIFGVAGSFVALLIWVYYSAQIIFFGAKFAQSFGKAIGMPIIPARYAQIRYLFEVKGQNN